MQVYLESELSEVPTYLQDQTVVTGNGIPHTYLRCQCFWKCKEDPPPLGIQNPIISTKNLTSSNNVISQVPCTCRAMQLLKQFNSSVKQKHILFKCVKHLCGLCCQSQSTHGFNILTTPQILEWKSVIKTFIMHIPVIRREWIVIQPILL